MSVENTGYFYTQLQYTGFFKIFFVKYSKYLQRLIDRNFIINVEGKLVLFLCSACLAFSLISLPSWRPADGFYFSFISFSVFFSLCCHVNSNQGIGNMYALLHVSPVSNQPNVESDFQGPNNWMDGCSWCYVAENKYSINIFLDN